MESRRLRSDIHNFQIAFQAAAWQPVIQSKAVSSISHN
jgi:hypothetical protein